MFSHDSFVSKTNTPANAVKLVCCVSIIGKLCQIAFNSVAETLELMFYAVELVRQF